ncbi:hypothetical protein ACFQS6_05455 [Xanthomonas populi]|uniref:Uncharacterized protein n=1 Tax=Xanthomonas populi TaxID=53414 RepID=A0A2S7E873_9XANT|nr:hypothetical protein [Xanthomonas populi]PPU86307.1 hypothetical protein XpopCFBP1817_19590 [Xanthomonas populi]
MKQHLELLEFAEEANSRMASDYHAGFFNMDGKLKGLLCETDVLSWLAEGELQKIANDPGYQCHTWEPNYLVVASGPKWQLRVGLYSHSSEFVYTMPQHMIVAVVGRKSLTADHYLMPCDIEIGTFDPSIRLEPGVRRVHEPGDLIVIDSRSNLFDVVIQAPVLTVKFTSTVHHPLQWAFHRQTGEA